MSDPNAPPQPQPPGRPAARSMADIARLFLDGARPTPTNGTPKRTAPRDRASTPAPPAPTSSADSPSVASNASNIPAVAPLALPHLTLALVDSADRASAAQLAAAANILAHQHDTSICLLALHDTGFTIDVLGVKSPAALPIIRPAAASPDLQIARALFTLRHAAGHWIIAAPARSGPDFASLAAALPDWLLVTATGNDEVIAAYHQLKHALLAGTPAHDPRVVILDDDPARAAIVHARLRRAAREFLKIDLPLAAIAPHEMVSPLRVADIPLSQAASDPHAIYATILDELCGLASQPQTLEEIAGDDDDAPLPADEPPMPTAGAGAARSPARPATAPAIDLDGPLDALADSAVDVALQADHSAAAADALLDHLANVLDPEERAALSAELPALEPDPQPVAAPYAHPTPATAPALPSPQPSAAPPPSSGAPAPVAPAANSIQNPKSKIKNPAPPSLRALDLLDDVPPQRPTQWQAVETSIADLLSGSRVLDARAPMAWAAQSCLALDPAGAVHVWTLYQDGGSWFALREWATEHMNLLALTQRDLPLDKAAPVTLHIVLPLEQPTGHADVSALLRTAAPNLLLYRLRTLQWHARRGMVVVPLA